MLQKNIDKEIRKQRKTWIGYYKRVTPTKIEKLNKINKRNKQKGYKNENSNNPSFLVNLFLILCYNIYRKKRKEVLTNEKHYT